MGKQFRRIAVLSITGAVAAGGVTAAYAALSSAGPDYRLASVTSADVTAALHVVGTLTPVQQADVAFSVSGPVAAVAVEPGQYVTAGQTLGSLDTTSLKAELTAAQSTLANANLRVANDTASENTAATTSATAAASRPTSPLRPLQQAVLSAQRTADGALAEAKTALGQARRACAPAPSPAPTTTPTATVIATKTATVIAAKTATAPPADPGTTHPAPVPAPAPATCAGATQRVLDAETAALQAQQAMSGQLAALNQAISSAVAAASKSSAGAGAGAGAGARAGAGGGGGRGGGSGGQAGAVSAAQLAADQASADAAAAQVTVAQQNLAAASVVSPISGTVVTVSVTPGSPAGAGSTAFVVAGLDSYQVVTTVPVTDMPLLRVGQQVSVQPDGMSTPLGASVVSIGLAPVTGGPATYAVTIGLTGQPSGLHAGGYAGVTITTARSSGVSVPTSAVHNSGHVATVAVYAGGKTHVTPVKVGTEGPVMTRITSGLTIGQQVVLADLSKPLPTNNLTNQFPGPGGGPGFLRFNRVIVGSG